MCGIVGYIGHRDAYPIILKGLQRLEYRGYDSAGIALWDGSEIQLCKTKGKVEELKQKCESSATIKGNIGIGHTRWATHGVPNDVNSHPHYSNSGDLVIIHNGIIENYDPLKQELTKRGYTFKSDTDTEVLVNLIEDVKKNEKVKLGKAVQIALNQTVGAYAIAVFDRKKPNEIVVARLGSPLALGVGEDEFFIASDASPFIEFTKNAIYLEDGQMAVVRNHKDLKIWKIKDDSLVAPYIQELQLNLEQIEKGGYDHFMLKEIFEQPALVKKLYSIYKEGHGLEVLKTITLNKPEFTHIIGCGTALHAGLVIKSFFENINSIRTQTDFASEFRYRNPLLKSNELGLFISQSGETADTLACQEMCQEKELTTLGVVNVEGSTLFRNCDKSALLHAGVEIGVASTKAFTQMVLVGYLISKSYEGLVEAEETAKEFENLAAAISLVLNQEEAIKQVAKDIYNYKGFIFTGRREQYPIALEGALKLKEIAYVHAEGYASGELKHGPIALFDESMVNIAIVTNDLFEKTISNAQEVKARLGVMVILGEDHNKELEAISDFYIPVNYHGLKELKPVVSNVVLQLLSYHIAKFKGTDIDKPRNLAKSVTVE